MTTVALHRLSKRFTPLQGEPYTAIEDFSLELSSGEFFCLLGPSGCGKTSILNILAGFEEPTSGTASVDGHPIRGPARDRGVVFQGDDSLFTWLTAAENVEFGLRLRGVGRRERRERTAHYLSLVGLGGQGEKYPGELSGGMKQRIQLARVLANEPAVLLMDEPFGALDAQTRSLMQAELRRIWEANRVLVVFITHDIDEAVSLGSRVGVMTAGPRSRLKATIPVELGGVRNRTDDAFMRVYREVHDLIRDEVSKANGLDAGDESRAPVEPSPSVVAEARP